MKHQKRRLSKENAIKCKHKSAQFWSFSLQSPCSMQTHEVIIFFLQKVYSILCSFNFSYHPLDQRNSQKHWGIQLDKEEIFEEHPTKVESKIKKTITIIRKLQHVVIQSAPLTIHNSLISPYLDYGVIICDKAFNVSFHAKMESLQYNATLVITWAIKRSSTEFAALKNMHLIQKKWVFCKEFLKMNHLPTFLILYQIVISNVRQNILSGNILSFLVKVRLTRPSSLSKQRPFYLLQWKPLKNDEKCFLFHLKSSFRSQDI